MPVSPILQMTKLGLNRLSKIPRLVSNRAGTLLWSGKPDAYELGPGSGAGSQNKEGEDQAKSKQQETQERLELRVRHKMNWQKGHELQTPRRLSAMETLKQPEAGRSEAWQGQSRLQVKDGNE